MTPITSIPYIQDMAFCLGKEGCLFITLCAIAEKITQQPIDLLRSARALIDKGLLDYVEENPAAHLKEAFFVKDKDAVLEYLTGIEGISVMKTHRLSSNEKRPYYIKYARKVEDKVYTHFVLPDYNSLYHSFTVENGAIDSYYIVIVPKSKKKGD